MYSSLSVSFHDCMNPTAEMRVEPLAVGESGQYHLMIGDLDLFFSPERLALLSSIINEELTRSLAVKGVDYVRSLIDPPLLKATASESSK